MSDLIQEFLRLLICYALVAGVVLLVLGGLYAFVPALRGRWLPLPRLRRVAWTGHEVFLSFCVLQGVPLLVLGVFLQIGFFSSLIGPEPEDNSSLHFYRVRCLLICSPLLMAATLALLFSVTYIRSQSRPHDYGLTWARWPANLALGLVSFLIATPVVYGIFFLANLATAKRSHFLEELARQDLFPWEWVLLGFQPLFMAPVLEEIVFRGILQGWLRRASLIGHIVIIGFTLMNAALSVYHTDPADGTEIANVEPLVFVGVLAAGYGLAMVRLARRYDLDEIAVQRWQPSEGVQAENGPREHGWEQDNANLALFGTAMLFAASHSEAWPAPIALLPLGLVLGWLRQRTQSLVGPITLHVLFNLVSLLVLYQTVLYPPQKTGNAQTTAPRPSVAGSTMSSVPTSVLPLRK